MSKPPVLSDGDGIVTVRAPRSSSRRIVRFLLFLAALTLCFSWPLTSLFSYALRSDLHSHIVLIPLSAPIFSTFIGTNFRSHATPRSVGPYFLSCVDWPWSSSTLRRRLSAGCDRARIHLFRHCRRISLPRQELDEGCDVSFRFSALHGSPSRFGRQLAGERVKARFRRVRKFLSSAPDIPVLREGTVFQLPNITIEVAQECSGIRSSWVLLIASTLASYLFLKRNSNRLILVLAAIPLGFLRNGFRIAVIGLLCVNLGPQMIHSPIHRQGGPLFFVLSLFPLFLLLWFLRRTERSRQPNPETAMTNGTS